MSVPTKIANLLRTIKNEHGFPISEEEALRYRLVGKATLAVMKELGLIEPRTSPPLPATGHPLYQSNPELASELARVGIWNAADAERAVKGRRLQPNRGLIPNLGTTRYLAILSWISSAGCWTNRRR